MQILARSHEHKIRTVTGRFVLSALPDERVVTTWKEGRKEGRKERNGRREKDGRKEKERERRKSSRERGTKALELIHPETDLQNPS